MNTEIKYAGFWIRFVANLIDSIWLYGIIYALLWVLIGSDIFNPDAKYTLTQFSFEYVIPFVVVMAFWIYTGATPGKMLFNLKIVDAETKGPVTPLRLVLRYLGYFISILPLGLGFLWIVWDKNKQSWHDKIAKTVIIQGS